MGKKKKNTSSSKSTLNSDEFDLVYAQTNSAVSMDTEKPLAGGPTDKKCTHLQKSLRMSSLRSCIKTAKLSKELQSCSACSIVNSKAKVKLNNQSTTEPATGTTETGQTNNNGGDATNTQVTSNSTEAIANPSSYWMCLTCAKIGCGRLSDKQHALVHFKEKTSHSTVINTTTFDLWCYACDDETAVENHEEIEELRELLEFQLNKMAKKEDSVLATLKAQMLLKQSNTAKATQASTLSLTTTKTDNNSSATESKAVETPSQSAPLPAVAAAATTATTTPLSTTTLKSKEKTTTPSSGPLPIRGLVNCGNTCFFNSVCQSLGQTKALIQMSTRPDAFQSFLPTKAALLTTVASLRAGSGKGSSSYTPTDLLVRAGAANSRFRGRQQQDAHELLRYILDAAREEERKKLTGQLSATPVTPTFQQKPSSSKNKTSSNTVSSSSSSPVTTPIKKSSSPPPKTWIDAIFGGELESRVTCLTCKNISTTTESFLDLSISLPQSKSVNSDSSSNKLSAATEARALLRQRLRKASAMEDIERQKARQSAAAASLDSAPATLSKHQQKKAKKQSRKKGKSREHKENSKDTEGTEKASDDENEKDSDDDEENKQENDNDNDSTSTKENNMAESNKSAEQFQENNNNNSSETEKINQLATKLESLVVEEKQQEQHQEEQQKEQQEQQENAAKSDQELEKTQNEDPIEQSEQEEIFYPPNSLEACLASFFVKELLTDSEKYGCSNCFKLRNKKLAQNDEDEQSEKEDEGKGEEENEEEKEKKGEEEEEKKESKNKVVGKNGLKKTLAPPSVIYSDATKQFLLKSAPLYICIHLKRFQQIGLRLQKDDRNIVFPFVLDLSKFMANTSSNGSSNIYDLYAVVVHQGGIGSGHYVSYVKVLSNDLSTTHGWYFTSDSHVSAVDESTVQKAQAFLLFYQKRVE